MPNFIEQVQQQFIQASLPGQHLSWLTALREKNLAQFKEIGLPTRKQENWKYTPIHELEKTSVHIYVPKQKEPVNINEYQLDCYNIVCINGHFILGPPSDVLPSGILMCSLAEALEQYPERLRDYLTAEFVNQYHQFALLNTVLMQTGLFISFPANTKLDKPLRILNVQQAGNMAMNNPRHIVVVGENSQVEIIEEYQSATDACYVNNIVAQYIVGSHAKLNYFKVQNENLHSYHMANTEFTLNQNSEVKSLHVGLGAKLAREDSRFQCQAEGAACRLRGLYLPKGSQHIDYHTEINHLAAHTSSDEYFKGIVADQARAVFNGRVYVAPHAQKTYASQSNKNILLDKTAEINTKPELEIYADDVKCSHGATVGQLDQRALFYLRSRSIDRVTAEKILIKAFWEEVLSEEEFYQYYEYIVKWIN